jgi:hypothetical protein
LFVGSFLVSISGFIKTLTKENKGINSTHSLAGSKATYENTLTAPI